VAAERATEPSTGAVPAQGPVDEDARPQPADVPDPDRAPQNPGGTQAVRRGSEPTSVGLPTMVTGLNVIVWERDPATLRLRFINSRAEELLGYPTEQWL